MEKLKKYECLSCGSILTMNQKYEESKTKCCLKPNLMLLSFEHDEEDSSVILSNCYEKYIDIWKYYLDFPEDYYKFLALWDIATYFFDEFETFPILFFNAMKGSGKTRSSKLINFLSSNGTGKVTNNISESAFFRHPQGVPMSLDEVERIATKDLMGLRELINAVYKKGGQIQRVKKVREKGQENFDLESHESRFPLTIANISGLEEVLEDRGFSLVLDKSNNPIFANLIEDWDKREDILEVKRTLRLVSVVSVVKLRQKMYIKFWNDYLKNSINYTTTHTTTTTLTALTTQQEDILEKQEREEFFQTVLGSGITGRNFELSFPLLLTAKLISEDVFADTLQIIKKLIGEKRDNEYTESRDVSLIDFVSRKTSNLEFISIKSLVQEFRIFTGESEDWLNERWIGRSLKRLNLITNKKREASGVFVMLNTVKATEKLKMFKTGEEK